LVGRPEGERQFARPRIRWLNDIKLYVFHHEVLSKAI